MKKLFFIGIISISSVMPIDAQWQSSGNNIYNTNSGNAGIGTNVPDNLLTVGSDAAIGTQLFKLRIQGMGVTDGSNYYGNYGGIVLHANNSYTGGAHRYLITNALGANKFAIIRSVDTSTDPALGTGGAITSGMADFVIDNSGNVGIGTTNPSSQLVIRGDGSTTSGAKILLEEDYSSNGQFFIQSARPSAGSSANRLAIGEASNEFLTIIGDSEGGGTSSRGNVGIGITNPGDYKLNVSGKIRADEVVVNTGGADFVFESDYKLLELAEIERYIKENKRLPDIPSASEMQENGMNVSEMQTKLLQKIEELTLFIIKLNEKIEKLESRNNK
jgi:hypothetical protein